MSDMPLERIVDLLGRTPRTAKMAHEIDPLRLAGDTIFVSEADFLTTAMAADAAVCVLQGILDARAPDAHGLLPCAHCGLPGARFSRASALDPKETDHWISCTDEREPEPRCGASTCFHPSADAALAAWNLRPDRSAAEKPPTAPDAMSDLPSMREHLDLVRRAATLEMLLGNAAEWLPYVDEQYHGMAIHSGLVERIGKILGKPAG